MFRKILITGAALIGLVTAIQANAHTVHTHSHNHHNATPAPSYNITVNLNLLLTLITNGVKNNSLTHQEEHLCRQDYARITQLRTTYNRGGLQHHEHKQLETHIRNAQKRVRDYSHNGQRRVIKKRQRPHVHHIHKPTIRWERPARKYRKHRKHRKLRPHRGSRMNRHHRGHRKGITFSNRHGRIRFNKHGIRIRINH